MKIVSKRISFILGLSSCIFINVLSIYNLSIGRLPTLFTLLFTYSAFAELGIIYYILNHRKKSLPNNFFNFGISSKILHICFYIIIILTLLDLKDSLYIKSMLYYFLVAIATVIIGIQIIKGESNCNILFLNIIPLAMVIRGSSFIVNPYLIGLDTQWHYHFIEQIIKNGYLTESAGHYYYYPYYHIVQSISGVVLGFSKDSLNLINFFDSIISVIIIYLIGRNVFVSDRAGIICSLLLTISTTSIFLVVFNTSKIGGTTLFLLCIYTLITIYNNLDKKIEIIFWLSAAAVFLWHPEISFALLVILGADLIIHTLIKGKFIVGSRFMIYIMSYITYLIFVNMGLFSEIVGNIFIDRQQSPGLIQLFTGDINIEFLFQLSMSYIGITLPVFFASYTALKWLDNVDKITFLSNVVYQNGHKIYLFLLLSIMSLHILPFIGIISGNFGLNPERTLVYVSTILIIISSGAIFDIFNLTNKTGSILLIVTLFILSFFSVSSYIIEDGNKVLNDRIPIQLILTTESNLVSYKFLNKTQEKSVIIGDSGTMSLSRGSFPLPNRTVEYLSSLYKDAYIVVNRPNLKMLGISNLLREEVFDRYLFNWKDIPGNENGRLITFMKKNFGINVRKVEKMDGGFTIHMFTDYQKDYYIKVDNDKNKAILYVDNMKIDEFVIRQKRDDGFVIYFENIPKLLYNNGDVLIYKS